MASLGGNLSSDASPCFFSGPGDQPATAPGIDAGLADNGGRTETIALLAGSGAIGAGLPEHCPARYRRGTLRRSPCAVGAVEAPEPGAAAALCAAAALAGLRRLGSRGTDRRAPNDTVPRAVIRSA